MASMYDKKSKFRPFIFGGLGGVAATTIIQPIDIVKVRIQIHGQQGVFVNSTNPFAIARQIYSSEGAIGFYRGISAAWLRQAVYGTARFGLFNTFSKMLAPKDGSESNFYRRVAAGLLAGGLGAFIGTPCDVALVRMQSDSSLPKHLRRNYTNVFNALWRMARNDGILTWWRGCAPTVYRAMAINVCQLAVYDQSKGFYAHYMDNYRMIAVVSSATSGACVAIFALPFDFVKTRLQQMVPLPSGQLPYSGFSDCVKKVVRKEGIFAFHRGIATFYMRVAPHAMVHLLTLEALNHMYNNFQALRNGNVNSKSIQRQ